MKSHITADFRKAFERLPPEIRTQARKAYRLFRENPNHPSLRFKPVRVAKPCIQRVSAWIIGRWAFMKRMPSSGSGLGHAQIMTG